MPEKKSFSATRGEAIRSFIVLSVALGEAPRVRARDRPSDIGIGAVERGQPGRRAHGVPPLAQRALPTVSTASTIA